MSWQPSGIGRRRSCTTLYDILRRPLVTEKSNYQVSKLHQYVFEVAGEATKTQVKDAVETLFDVKVCG